MLRKRHILVIFVVGVSVTTFLSISAQQNYDIPVWVKGVAGFWAEDKISDQEFGEGISFLIDQSILKVPLIQELKEKNNQLEKENTELRIKLGTHSSEQKTIPIPKSETGSNFPSITKKYEGTDAVEKIKELLSFQKSLTKSQIGGLLAKEVSESEFAFGIIYDGIWTTMSTEGNSLEFSGGKGITLVPFDCSHSPNYMHMLTIMKVDEYGLASGIMFKNGIAISFESSDKPFASIIIVEFCDEPLLGATFVPETLFS